MTAYTFVATVENRVGGDTPAMLGYTIEKIRELLGAQGWTVVPCDWAPDADTIADAVEADTVEVIDFNPSSPEAHADARLTVDNWVDRCNAVMDGTGPGVVVKLTGPNSVTSPGLGFSIEDWHFLLSPCCTASLMDEGEAHLICGDCGEPTEYTTASTTPEAHTARLAATMQS